MDDSQRHHDLMEMRELALNWGRWCNWRGELGSPLGRYPKAKHGGVDRQYRAPPQWHPPGPKPPEPHDPSGLEFQLVYIKLPQVYRRVLTAEFCRRPWFLRASGEAGMVSAAMVARISPRAYENTVDRALLSIRNLMLQKKFVKGLTKPRISVS